MGKKINIDKLLDLTGLHYIQLAATAKPTLNTYDIGVKLYCYDSHETYIWDGSAWRLYLPQVEVIESGS